VPVDAGSVLAVEPEVAEGVGGVILFGDDATARFAAQLGALRARALGGIAPAVMVDEEGGSVQRLASLVGQIPSARTMAASMSDPAISALARRVGSRLAALGVTVDLAPVVDLDANPGPNSRDPDGTRSYSANPSVTTSAALAFAAGLSAAGILPVFKHFPGLGGASANTDLRAASTLPYASLRSGGLIPFERAIAAGAKAIMVSNASVPGVSPLPSSISPAVITALLRHDLGYGGLVITDSLSVPSVTPAGGSLAHTATAALAAGADMLLFNASAATTASTTQGLVAAIAAAVQRGALTRTRLVTAVGRVLRAKHALPPCAA